MEKHYICTGGCKGESETPGVCQTAGCPKEGQPLTECGCEDRMHGGAFEEVGGEKSGQEPKE